MKPLRVIAFVILLVGVFYFLTDLKKLRNSAPESDVQVTRGTEVTRPEYVQIAEASGPLTLDAEEQMNVTVYRKALPSVVNITSTAVAFDFFYGAVPQQGAGSGF